MKKKFIAGLVLSFSLVTTGVCPTFAETNTKTVNVVELPESVGVSVLEQMLQQQKVDFKKGTPLANSDVSKLTETDEGVLLYSALSQVDKQKFHDFDYEIQNVKVYKDVDEKAYVEAYIIRNFTFGNKEKVTSGLGDNVKVEITDLDLNSNINTLNVKSNDKKKVKMISNSAEGKVKNKDLTLDKFLKKYKEEVDKDKVKNTEVTKMALNEPTYVTNAAYTYNRWAAKEYAYKYALSPNTAYKYYDGADCTNFVSQALRAGSMPYFDAWKPYTDAWINAGEFRLYIRQTGGILMKTVDDTYSNAALGDVYHYDYRTIYFTNTPDGWMEHTAIVTSKANSKILVSYHSTNRRDVPREYFTSVEGGDRWLSSIVNN